MTTVRHSRGAKASNRSTGLQDVVPEPDDVSSDRTQRAARERSPEPEAHSDKSA